MKKMYCLVVTYDYSRFSWVLFLATTDETNGILKAFITGIENQTNHIVKIIRCDNGTEFKNKEMNQFCEMKGIKREFSVARTPQQNGNRVLVIKPHNKTPYELFNGRPPTISFIRPFGCPVTILNTLDHLGSGPEWLLDIDTLTKSINYKPVVAGNQPNGNAGAKESLDVGQAGKKTVPGHEYILLPLCTSGLPISSSPKSSDDEVGDDTQKKSTKAPAKEDDKDDQDLRDEFEREFERLIIQGKEAKININSTNNINTGSLTVNTAGIEDNVVDENVIIGYAHDPNIPELEDIGIFGAAYDDENFVAGGDMNNLESTMSVSPIATTRIHKDHPVMQKEDGIFISQDKYVDEILKKFGFSNVKIASTPMETSNPLTKNPEAEDVDVHLYRSMIGSLMYLTASRPDIMFDVCTCARFQVTPKVLHLYAVERIFRYLKGQPKLGLWYPKDSPFDLKAYSDSDYAGASLDRKSTIGVANSTTEAEYVAAGNWCGQLSSMATLTFADSHNMVDYLEKSIENTDFDEIIDFLNAHTIRYALTKKRPRRKQRKDTEVSQPSGPIKPITDEAANEEHVPTHSNDLLLSGEDRLKLNKLIELCTNLSQRVLDLENTKTSQAAKITKLKERVKKLERKNKSRTPGLKRKIDDLDADAEVTLVDEAQGRNDDNLMFDPGVFDEQEVEVEKVISTAEVTTASATTTTVDELTLAQTLIEIKSKSKAIQLAAKHLQLLLQDPRVEELQFKSQVNVQKQHHLHNYHNFHRFTHSQLKNKSFDEVQKAFDKTIGWIDSFVSMDSKVVKGGKEKDEDDDQEEAEMKHMEIVVDEEEIAVDAIPLATKPLIIID
ncbi:uncharacterized mitochondrial protein-like protein [Tanacetum coccineum]